MLSCRQLHIDQSIPRAVRLEDVRVGRAANLALELPPGVSHIVCRLFYTSFLPEPVLQALEVDVTDAAIALARVEQWVSLGLVPTPTDLALDLLGPPRTITP